MTNLLQATKTQAQQLIEAAFAAAMAAGALTQGPLPGFIIEIPSDTTKGDFATNAAMVGARSFGMAPRKIAEILLAHMPLEGTSFAGCEIAGPGFINFFVKPQWFGQALEAVLTQAQNYGRSDYGQNEKIMVEFISANPTGPMHMGNARGGAIGDCLAAALDWAGYDVCREFYVNDAGNQIERFALSLEARYIQHYKGEDAAVFPEDGYHGEDIKAHAAAFAAKEGDAYLETDPQTRKDALVAFALPLNLQAMRDNLSAYRIVYDNWFMESTLHADGSVTKMLDVLESRNMTYKKDDAIWYKATLHGGEKDEVLVRANGYPTYFAADIAYHYNKFVTRGFSRVINVWGADHHGHVARLKGAMDAMGLRGDKLDIVLMQLVRLLKDGTPVKMSKRTGKAITLTDLTEEIPIDAARFFFNLREPNSTLDFDLDLAVEQSSQNPVYYVQYAHARICSILKNAAAQGIVTTPLTPEQALLLTTPEERELVRKLAFLPSEIIDAAKGYDPARLTKYVIDVATLLHKFYGNCRVQIDDAALQNARLNLCIGVRTVLRNTLDLLKIQAPEEM